MRLSIIVPIYNVEDYISHCALSLYNQTASREDYEVIFVNDGTKDNSIRVLRGAIDFDATPNFHIVEKVNGGLSSARNYGIKYSSGEYIWFVDSDDWIDEGKIHDVLKALDNIDLLLFNGHYRNFEIDGRETIIMSRINVQTGLDLAKENYFIPAPFYIIRKEILIDAQHYFKEGIFHEDILFTPIAILLCNKVKCFTNPIYHYRQREGSITKVVNSKRIVDLIYVIDTLINYGKEKLPENMRYKWGKCVVEGLNYVLYLSQNCNDRETLLQLKMYVNQNWEAYKFLLHAGTKNKIMGILSYITLGRLYQLYKVIYRFRKKIIQ